MTDKPSLAARVHAHLGNLPSWSGTMTVDEQTDLFGVPLSDKPRQIEIAIGKHGMPFVKVEGDVHMLKGIQSDVETAADLYGDDDFENACSFDFYRSFPRDESAFVGVQNSETGFAEVVVATDLEQARRNLARYHGYANWSEMISLLPAPEAWTVVWTDGDPEESRQQTIAGLTAERKELAGKFDAVGRVVEIDGLLEMYTLKDRPLEGMTP